MGNILYIKFIEYIKDLHLLAYPPERVFTLRPSFYISLSLIGSSDIREENGTYIVDRESLGRGLIKYSISMLRDDAFDRLSNILKEIHKKDALYIVKKLKDRNRKESFEIEKITTKDDQKVIDGILKRETFVILKDKIEDLYDSSLGLLYMGTFTAEEKTGEKRVRRVRRRLTK
jgi:hypothetical protein